MKVSIIVPVYNTENKINKCFNSLINQKFDDYQIILVNDGSTDNTSTILHKIASKYSNVIVVDQENKKEGGARNAGLKIASGEYIMFVDADDFIDENTLSVTYNKAISKDYDIVYFSTIDEDDSGNVLRKSKTLPTDRLIITAWKKLIKKSYIEKLDNYFIENRFVPDLCFSMILKNGGGNSYYLSDCYYYHYIKNTTSILNSGNIQVDIDSMYCMDIYKDWLIKNDKYVEDDFYYIVFHEILINRAKHAMCVKHPLAKQTYRNIIEYCHKNIPHYKQMPFYKQESLKYKLLAFCTEKNISIPIKLYYLIKG